ncbi:MAG: pentapeptide repeat-containing protein [Cyanobacteria bacterium]|nr:pentapeptide repeat-containing protein [Cyanobacteriota bacterium]MDW8202704.1 pentapeptide repeat-containing protein [Cyanobacteriota bacterium SKYGB_h_bin112]
MTSEDLLRRYAAGERDFRGIELQGANLEGANLQGANLQQAVLCLSNLSQSNLTDADLSYANLVGADLMHVCADRARFTGAKILGADLRGSSLVQADFTDALLSGSLLAKVNLQEANLRGVVLSHVVLHRANLQDSDLTDANLAGADLRWANLSGAEIRRVDLIGTGRAPTILPDGAVCPFNLRVRDLMKARESTLFALGKFADRYRQLDAKEWGAHSGTTGLGQCAVIRQQISHLCERLGGHDLQLQSARQMIKLTKANGQLVAIVDVAHEPPKALIRYGSEYWYPISLLLVNQQFVPLGRSQKYPSFSEHEYHPLPAGFTLHFAQATELQRFWQEHEPVAANPLTMMVLSERTWHPIVALHNSDEDMIHVTIMDHCLTLRPTEFVTWMSLPIQVQGKVAIDYLWTEYSYL